MPPEGSIPCGEGGYLKDDEVDEKVGGGRQGGADAGGNAAWVFDDGAQLAENGATQHGAQQHVENVPHKEIHADAAVQLAQGVACPLLHRDPVQTYHVYYDPDCM